MRREIVLTQDERAVTDAPTREDSTSKQISEPTKRTLNVIKMYLSNPEEYGKKIFTKGDKN